jgi:hypothetical protein
VAIESEFACWYDNGFGSGKWKADKKDGLVKDCTLRITEDKFILQNGKATVACPWSGVKISVGPSNRGNAVLTVGLADTAGGTSKIVLPDYTCNAFWAELWRVAAVIRPRLGSTEPIQLKVAGTPPEVLMDYMGGYPLRPDKSSGIWVRMGAFGVGAYSGFRKQREMFFPWRDVTALTLEGMLDAQRQRQRSAARTIEFGVLGGLAGKQVTTRSAYLFVSTNLGEVIFHTDRMTVPELRAKYAAVLPTAERAIQERHSQPTPALPSITPPSAPRGVADELAKLAQLRDSGVLTEEEFAAQKAKLLL